MYISLIFIKVAPCLLLKELSLLCMFLFILCKNKYYNQIPIQRSFIMEEQCALCEREGVILTKHHLLPREEGGKEAHIAMVCQDCHKHIHALYTNKELAIRLDSITKLKEDEQISKYLKFIRKQPPSKQVRIKKSAARKKRS